MKSSILNLPPVSIDGSWRVNPGAKVVVARNGQGFESLTLKNHSSIAIYSSFANNDLYNVLKHCLKWSRKQPESIITVLHGVTIDSNNEVRVEQVQLEETIRVLDELLDYAKSYQETLLRERLISSPNGKFVVTPLALSNEALKDLRVQNKLAEIVELSSFTTVRPLLILENPRYLALSLQNQLSWQGFLGKSLESYCRDKYNEAFTDGMRTRIAIGLAVNRVEEAYRVINNLNYEPNQIAKEEKLAVANDAEEYRRFIEGLTDGKI